MRVAFLTNLIPPYHKPLYLLLSRQFEQFRLFISTPMEANRPWQPDWTGLDVVVQKGFTLGRQWKHPGGFGEALSVHFPLDTLSQLRTYQPDTIISSEMGFRTLLACVYVKLHPGSRLFVWSEVTAITERGRGLVRHILRRVIARRADGFLAVGQAGVNYIESLGVAAGKIFQIAYSTDLQPFLNLQLERPRSIARHLLYSGQLVERKGLVPFVRALADWAELHPTQLIEFRIVGGGPLHDTLAAIPLPANVKLLFIGTLQYHQLPTCYADSGIFVLPTLADTWAVVINEALASGLPVLGSVYSQAVAEMVDDGLSGWTFHPDRKEEIFNALDRAFSVSDLELNAMRVQARRKAMEVTPEKTAAVCFQALYGPGTMQAAS